jgi:hypothetical protein
MTGTTLRRNTISIRGEETAQYLTIRSVDMGTVKYDDYDPNHAGPLPLHKKMEVDKFLQMVKAKNYAVWTTTTT